MPFNAAVERVRTALNETAAEVDVWFDRPEPLWTYRQSNGGWSIQQVLEHITLTTRFLLLTCEKHERIAQHRATRGDRIPDGESDLERMATIGERGSFRWIRPEHMEPTGAPPMVEVRATLSQQWRQCHEILEALRGGKGALCHVTMTVNQLGKIDLYQWLYFVALHARRHVQQMRSVEAEFRARGNPG
ncbi:MAG: DinB family protein [Bryobacteraceae bacterium]